MSAPDEVERTATSPGRPWTLLLVGAALLLLSNGRYLIAPAAWVALVPWLLFVDRTAAGRGLPVAFAVWLAVFLVAWRGIVPAPGPLYLAITGAYAVVYFTPVVLHRVLARRLGPIAATLVFPFGWVGIEMVFERWITPYGSWFSIAYSQTAGPLLQVAALAGTAGISFLIAWLASALAVAAARRPGPTRRRAGGLVVWTAVIVLVLAWGELRLARAGSGPPLVRTATILPDARRLGALREEMAPIRLDRPVEADVLDGVARLSERLNDDLFERSLREARAGARIVAWSETAGRVLASREEAFLSRGRALAAEQGVSLLLAYGVWQPGASPPLRNQVAAIGPDGRVAWAYEKSHPIVGPESPFVAAGDGRIRALAVGPIRVAAVICHDLDFPALLRQAAAVRADLVVAPSDDWPVIADIHARMARLRAIESGFSLLRPTRGGRTLAVDAWGRLHASVDYPHDAVVASLPVGRVDTVYAAAGDWLGWTSLAGLLGLALAALSRRARSRASRIRSHRET